MQYMLRSVTVAVALVFATPLYAQTDEPVLGSSVDSLLQYARERNPEYALMRYEAEASVERAASAGALPDPKLRVELEDITRMGERSPTLSPNKVGKAKYQLMQEVPWFGKRDLQREVASLDAEAAKGRALGSWTEISSRIKAGYAQYYYIHQNERLTREILDLMTRLENVAQVRYAGGLAAQSDAIRAQVELTNLRNELIALEGERRMAEARLNMLLGRAANASFAAPERLRPLPAPVKLDYRALLDRVQGRNPQLLADEAKLRSAEKSRELTYKNRYPDFAFGIAPVQSGSSVREWGVMVELNIPLQQGARRAQEREAEAMTSAARARREATANQVQAELTENLSSLEAARRTEAAITNSLLPQAELTFKAALASYETGKVDFATLLDAQRQIRMARQTQIKIQAEAQSRLAELERLVGDDL